MLTKEAIHITIDRPVWASSSPTGIPVQTEGVQFQMQPTQKTSKEHVFMLGPVRTFKLVRALSAAALTVSRSDLHGEYNGVDISKPAGIFGAWTGAQINAQHKWYQDHGMDNLGNPVRDGGTNPDDGKSGNQQASSQRNKERAKGAGSWLWNVMVHNAGVDGSYEKKPKGKNK